MNRPYSFASIAALSIVLLAVAPTPAVSQDAPVEAATPTVVNASDVWWTVFNDAELTMLVDRAIKESPTIELAAARLDRAAASAQAVRASLLPNASASGGASRTRQSLEDPALQPFKGNPDFPRDQERFRAGVAASWEIDLFGSSPRRRAARATQESFVAELEATKVAVAAETATTWLGIRELQSQRVHLAAQLAALSEQEAIVLRRVSAGTAPLVDADRFVAERANQAAAIAVIDGLIAAEIERLGVLVADAGLARTTAAKWSQTPLTIALPDLDALSISLENRPDVIAAEQRLIAADAGVSVAKRQRFPRISLAGLLATIASGPAALFSGTSESYEFGGAVSVPLFDFGRIDASIAQARGNQREALAQVRKVSLEAAADVARSAAFLESRRREMAAQKQARDALGSSRERVGKAYEAGTIDLGAVLDVERQRLNAETGYTSAQAEAAKALVAVFRSAAQSDR